MSEESTNNYCYSFKKIHYKGFGARIYEILLAYHYCRRNNTNLHLIKGDTWNLLKAAEEVKDGNQWHIIFRSIPDLLESPLVDDKYVWPAGSIGDGWNAKPPNEFSETPKIVWYSRLLKEIYQLQPRYENIVQELVDRSGFKETDIVIHLRLSDKIKYTQRNAVPESAEVKISWYTDEVVKYIKSMNLVKSRDDEDKWRVFVCTDDESVLKEVETLLQPYDNIKVIWDPYETRRNGYIPKFFDSKSQITAEEANDEVLIALKNLKIMTDASFIVGARASYFFRVGELLHYPKPSVNVKDSDIFGIAEYEESGTQQVRKCKIKAYLDFINPKWKDAGSLVQYSKILETDGIVTIPDVIEPALAEKINDFFHNKMPDNWFSSAHLPNQKGEYTSEHLPGSIKDDDPIKKSLIERAQSQRTNTLFGYYFYRTLGNHYDTCYCEECRLRDSVHSFEFLEFFSNVIGSPATKVGEVFLSKYQKGNFLNMHHDKKKGKYAFTLSFNKNWDPVHGGLLHFWDSKTRNIYKTSVPQFNCLNIFRIPEEDEGFQRDHFVTEVVGPKKRITLTGWVS